MLQRGKCNGCKEKISPLYPSMELATGILFSLSYMTFGFQVELIMALLLISMLIIIFITDITYMLIPNKILLFFLSFFIIIRFILLIYILYKYCVCVLIIFVFIVF